MINHARTLLLNKAYKDNHITRDTGAEYVPLEFVPVRLSNELKLLRRVLFGSNPDARFINLRVRELMSYIHQTELADYVHALDHRMTYWPLSVVDFYDTSKKTVTITQLNGPPQRLTIIGDYQADNSVGRSLFQYVISAGTETPTLPMQALAFSTDLPLIATAQELSTTADPITADVGTAAESKVMRLENTGLKVLLDFANQSENDLYASIITEAGNFLMHEIYGDSAGNLISDQMSTTIALTAPPIAEVIAQWFVTVRAIPLPIITTGIPTIELLGEPIMLALFGLGNEEPYATFRNLWRDHNSPVYRLAGLTMALIYRTEELRTNKNA
jgi:hypothetical protein